MGPTLIHTSIAIAALAAIFSVLQWFWPAIPGQKTFRGGMLSDLGYFVLTPFIAMQLTRFAVILAVLPLAFLWAWNQ